MVVFLEPIAAQVPVFVFAMKIGRRARQPNSPGLKSGVCILGKPGASALGTYTHVARRIACHRTPPIFIGLMWSSQGHGVSREGGNPLPRPLDSGSGAGMTIGTPPVLILLMWPDKAIVIREKLLIATVTPHRLARAGGHPQGGGVPLTRTEQLLLLPRFRRASLHSCAILRPWG